MGTRPKARFGCVQAPLPADQGVSWIAPRTALRADLSEARPHPAAAAVAAFCRFDGGCRWRPSPTRPGLRAKKWWRWGRVELPVQKPSPETTTSVSDDLSSSARTAIGSLPNAPVTFPSQGFPWLAGFSSGYATLP